MSTQMTAIDPESNMSVDFLADEAMILSEPLMTQTHHDTRSSSTGTNQGGALSTIFHMLLASAGFLLVSILVFALGRIGHHNTTPPATGNSSSTIPPASIMDGIFLLDDVIRNDDNSRFEVLVQLFRDKNVSQEAVSRDESTPQHAALDWLANEDLARLDLETTPNDILIERFVMVLLYVSTGGWDWSYPLRFLRDTNVCDWYSYKHDRGIICNEDQTSVTGINIAGNYLVGTLPSEISLLSNLRSLQLQDNFLQGTIPEEISMLGGSLEELNLAYNSFQGTVPTELVKLSKLDAIFIQGNDLTGSLDYSMCHREGYASPISEFGADCGGITLSKINCVCCTVCCDGDNCNFQEFVTSAPLVYD